MTFKFSGAWLRLVANQRTVSIEASNFSEALTKLTDQHPQLKGVLLDDSGQVRRNHYVVVNGDPVAQLSPDMPLSEHDQIEFLTRVS
ncbi:MoaD/ThiS family protein [Streptomyces sp. NPDC100445]|uniref:MoaD/ThiS family protein n=1 Tax=Streptomyces sp. NPDC100445 TaxID=3366102 RepID=UPI00380AA12E